MYNNDYGLIAPAPTPETNGLESLFGAATGAVIALIVIGILIAIAIIVVMIVAECKMFTKAGEKWWKALIPGYSTWVLTKITGLAWWWFPIFAVLTGFTASGTQNYVYPMALVLVSFNYSYNMAKKFGKSNGFALLVTILPVVGLPILAFGSATYNKEAPVDKNGIFSIENN